ncbi:MAG: penicillin-binding protein activator [bacterium]
MNKTNKILVSLVVLIVIMLVGYSIWNANNKEKIPETVKIGVLAPLSGNSAFMGQDTQNGILLAAKEFPNAQIQFEDSKDNAEDMVSAYQKIMATFKPDVLIAENIGIEALIPLAQADKTPLFLTISSGSGIPSQGEYIFRYFTNADVDAPIMADYAVKTLGLKKIAILYLQDTFGIDYSKVFSQEVKRVGAEVVAQEMFTWTDYDYKTQLTKLKQKDFDSIYLVGLDFQLLTALRQIKELGINTTVLSVGTIATMENIQKAEGTMEGVYVTAFCLDESPKGYVTKFQQEYSSYPGFFSELGYDMANMIKDAVQRKGYGKEKIREGLATIKDFSGNAGIVTADTTGEIIIPTCIKKIQEGKIYNTKTRKYYQ